MIGFQHQGIDPAQYAVKSGRPCMSLMLAKDKREAGKYGDTDEELIWRNELSELFKHSRDEILEFKFSLCFGEGFDVDYGTVAEIHSSYPQVSLFHFEHRDGVLMLKQRGEIIREDIIIQDEWVDYEVSIHMKEHDAGWLRITRNGELVLGYDGAVMTDSEEEMYFKIGAYTWTRDDRPAWTVNKRKVYFQL